MKTCPPELSNLIRTCRENAKLAKVQLAIILGVSPPMVNHYETGKKLPRKEIFLKFVAHFNLTEEDLRSILPAYDMEALPSPEEMPAANELKAPLCSRDIDFIAGFLTDHPDNTPVIAAACLIREGKVPSKESITAVLNMSRGGLTLNHEQWESILLTLSNFPRS